MVVYSGNYSYYVKEKEKNEILKMEEFDRYDEYMKSQTQLIQRFRA
jgi:ATPase subunit of ABC transporter with duplicated ATPase domains